MGSFNLFKKFQNDKMESPSSKELKSKQTHSEGDFKNLINKKDSDFKRSKSWNDKLTTNKVSNSVNFTNTDLIIAPNQPISAQSDKSISDSSFTSEHKLSQAKPKKTILKNPLKPNEINISLNTTNQYHSFRQSDSSGYISNKNFFSPNSNYSNIVLEKEAELSYTPSVQFFEGNHQLKEQFLDSLTCDSSCSSNFSSNFCHHVHKPSRRFSYDDSYDLKKRNKFTNKMSPLDLDNPYLITESKLIKSTPHCSLNEDAKTIFKFFSFIAELVYVMITNLKYFFIFTFAVICFMIAFVTRIFLLGFYWFKNIGYMIPYKTKINQLLNRLIKTLIGKHENKDIDLLTDSAITSLNGTMPAINEELSTTASQTFEPDLLLSQI